MRIEKVTTIEEMTEAIEALTKVFIKDYPYYSEWIKKNEVQFSKSEKEIYGVITNGVRVGYLMIHYSSSKIVKINAIYIFSEYEGKGYASNAFKLILEKLDEEGYEHVLIQTRLANRTVVHMFNKLEFVILGINYHPIEKQENWVAIYDLKGNAEVSNMNKIATEFYPDFRELTQEKIVDMIR